MGRGPGMGRIGVLMSFLGVPLINRGADRGFDGFYGVYGGGSMMQ